MVDCQNCRYRKHLARAFDIHVWKEDCDKYGTDICKAMNAPIDSTYLSRIAKEVPTMTVSQAISMLEGL